MELTFTGLISLELAIQDQINRFKKSNEYERKQTENC